MTVEPGVSLERFAELRAEMDGGSRRDDVLAREKLGPEAWTEAQRVWLERMGAEIERGRFELTNRYSKAFVTRQAAIAGASAPVPPVAPVAPVAPPAVVSPAVRFPSSPSASSSPPPPAVVPSFLAAPAEEVAPVTSPLPPVVPQGPADIGRTAFGARAPFGPSLPFTPPSASKTLPASEPPPRAAPPVAAKERFGTTTAGPSHGPALPATPFETSGPFGFTVERYAALSAELELGGDPNEVLQRHGIDREQKAKVDAHYQQRFSADPVASLTFMRQVAQETARIKANRGSSPPVRRASQPQMPAPAAAPKKAPFGSTAFLSSEASPKAALPFQPKSQAPAIPARSPELTLQQYASLCAELAASATPAATSAILAKYRVGEPGARLALDATWAAEFAKSPPTRVEFERLMAEYRAWLLRRP